MNYERKLLRASYATIIASIAVVALLVLPGRAGAVNLTFDYGAQSVPTTLYWGPLALSHGPSESFTDHILFQTSSPFTAQLFDNYTNFSNFASLTAGLYTDDGFHTLVYAADPNTPSAPFAWSNAVPSGPIAAGNYQVHISGVMAASITPNPTGESGGIVLAAIPEPETYAMMLAGLGLMGFIARRRSREEVA
jgi:hypothetical protein